LNDLNLSLQSPGVTILNVHDRIEAMLKKFNFWIQCLQMNEYECFGSLSTILSVNEIQLNENIKRDITEHLKQLRLPFKDYVPNKPITSGSNNWIRNAFQGDITSDTSLTLLEKEKLIDLSSDNSLQAVFKDHSLLDFWLSVKNEYPALAEKAIKLYYLSVQDIYVRKDFQHTLT
jgi:hypothetical protein